MEKGRKLKVIILFMIAVLSSLLTILDYFIVDPVPFIDEIGFTGVTLFIWKCFAKAIKNSKNNNKLLENK